MLSTLSEQEVQAVEDYNRQVRTDTVYKDEAWLDSFILETFVGVSRDEELIDVGCFVGRTVPIVHELGFDNYFGIDPAEEAIRFCRKKFPQYEFSEDEIRTIGKHFPMRFGAFFLTAVLMHIPSQDIRSALLSLRACLKIGAKGYIAMPISDVHLDGYVTRAGQIATFYTAPEIVTHLKSCGFSTQNYFVQRPMLYLDVRAE